MKGSLWFVPLLCAIVGPVLAEITLALDDGVGCEIAPARSEGTGLRNMNERVVAVRGTLTIDSGVGRGTHVRGRIPLLDRR